MKKNLLKHFRHPSYVTDVPNVTTNGLDHMYLHPLDTDKTKFINIAGADHTPRLHVYTN